MSGKWNYWLIALHIIVVVLLVRNAYLLGKRDAMRESLEMIMGKMEPRKW